VNFSIDAADGLKKPRMKFDEMMLRASTNMIDCEMEVDTSTDLETMASTRFSGILLKPFSQNSRLSRFSIAREIFRFSSTAEGPSSKISESVHETSNGEAPQDDERNESTDWRAVILLVLQQLSQPAIVASLMGIFISSVGPLRGLLVDTVHRNGGAPLQWAFNGLYAVGQAAIPINMFLLGSTLTQGVKNIPPDFRWIPNLGVAFGKMVVMPSIGVFTILFIVDNIVMVSSAVKPSLYFALLVVSATPTANNINVMAEIGGVNKDTMALCLLTQYVVAPVLLTAWIFIFTLIVSKY
jgi:predicted permease